MIIFIALKFYLYSCRLLLIIGAVLLLSQFLFSLAFISRESQGITEDMSPGTPESGGIALAF